MTVRLTDTTTQEVKQFPSREVAGAYLRRLGWPEGLLYAPDEDRVGLASCMHGSPWKVEEE